MGSDWIEWEARAGTARSSPPGLLQGPEGRRRSSIHRGWVLARLNLSIPLRPRGRGAGTALRVQEGAGTPSMTCTRRLQTMCMGGWLIESGKVSRIQKGEGKQRAAHCTIHHTLLYPPSFSHCYLTMSPHEELYDHAFVVGVDLEVVAASLGGGKIFSNWSDTRMPMPANAVIAIETRRRVFAGSTVMHQNRSLGAFSRCEM